MSEEAKITVVYLAWLPYGPAHLRSFIRSYTQHAAGLKHELLIIFNGFQDDSTLLPFQAILDEYRISCNVIHKKRGQDIEAYFEAARATNADFVFFLNTYSILLEDHWLKKYYAAINEDGVGLVSATASWQSYYDAVIRLTSFRWENEKDIRHNIGKYKLLIKAALYWPLFFKSFPNPHVRTNAFMIRRHSMLQLHCKPVNNKFRAYLFESGRNSMTNQVIRQGYRVVVVDKYGHSHSLKDCKSANVFWAGKQENLLVSDNQTRIYDDAGEEQKKVFHYLAWHSSAAYKAMKASSK